MTTTTDHARAVALRATADEHRAHATLLREWAADLDPAMRHVVLEGADAADLEATRLDRLAESFDTSLINHEGDQP